MQPRAFFSRGSPALVAVLLSAGTAMLALAGCAPAAAGRPLGPAQSPRIQQEILVSPEWLASRTEDPGVVILHVGSERAEYDRGHLPGARFLPLRAIIAERDGNVNELAPVAKLDSAFESVGVADGVRVVVYGAPLAAARAFFTLDYLGHGERTALLNGGLEGWRAAGHPLSTDEPRPRRGAFTPRPVPERVVDAGWIRQRLGDAALALLDARPEAQYSGEVAGDGIARAGHIPGAGNVFWERMIHSPQHPVLHDPEALLAMFRAAGVDPGDTVVAYCRSGMQASFAYFVARYLGYETRMYDGSFLDWSPRVELPVER